MDAPICIVDSRVGRSIVARPIAEQLGCGEIAYVGHPAKGANQVVAVAGAGT
jgi:hypothetical protein